MAERYWSGRQKTNTQLRLFSVYKTIVRRRDNTLRRAIFLRILRQHRTMKTAALCGNFVSWLRCDFTVIRQVLPQNRALSVRKIYSQTALVPWCGIALNLTTYEITVTKDNPHGSVFVYLRTNVYFVMWYTPLYAIYCNSYTKLCKSIAVFCTNGIMQTVPKTTSVSKNLTLKL